jgi:hypothetical protein
LSRGEVAVMKYFLIGFALIGLALLHGIAIAMTEPRSATTIVLRGDYSASRDMR